MRLEAVNILVLDCLQVLEGHRFVARLSCMNRECGHYRELVHLAARLDPHAQICPACGGDLTASSFDLFERLVRSELSPSNLELSLHDSGLLAGDVITVGTHEEQRHYEI